MSIHIKECYLNKQHFLVLDPDLYSNLYHFFYITEIVITTMFLLLPNNLFPIQHLSKDHQYILYEHPSFFRKNIHINKLILHRITMTKYYNHLKKSGYNTVYISLKDKPPTPASITDIFDPANIQIEKQYKNATNHPSPLFLHSREHLEEYHKNNKNPLFHHTFKIWSIRRIGIPNMEKSYDTENRKRLSSIPHIPQPQPQPQKQPNELKEAEEYIKSLSLNSVGSTDGFMYPTTREQTLKIFDHFIKNKLKHFGEFQDAMLSLPEGNNNTTHNNSNYTYNTLYHSLLSSSLNIGLITPKEVVERIIKEKNISLNNYEGFLRQIVGWREYMRYAYHYHYSTMISSNYFNNTKKLSKVWWQLKPVGIYPIDDCMIKLRDTGYLHHIERLMIILNWMVLSEIHPSQMFKWFNDMFIDAYDWVMLGNVYIFSYSHKGSRKPYISSSNYIVKMSDYGKLKNEWNEKNEWRDVWDRLYKDFLQKKKDMLKGTIYYTQIK